MGDSISQTEDEQEVANVNLTLAQLREFLNNDFHKIVTSDKLDFHVEKSVTKALSNWDDFLRIQTDTTMKAITTVNESTLYGVKILLDQHMASLDTRLGDMVERIRDAQNTANQALAIANQAQGGVKAHSLNQQKIGTRLTTIENTTGRMTHLLDGVIKDTTSLQDNIGQSPTLLSRIRELEVIVTTDHANQLIHINHNVQRNNEGVQRVETLLIELLESNKRIEVVMESQTLVNGIIGRLHHQMLSRRDRFKSYLSQIARILIENVIKTTTMKLILGVLGAVFGGVLANNWGNVAKFIEESIRILFGS